ncbi:MAG: hypothetical protein RMK99_17515 [Anaerolineales bacterium]|nr:hypothetical protein [Anaerolineales bacterium]
MITPFWPALKHRFARKIIVQAFSRRHPVDGSQRMVKQENGRVVAHIRFSVSNPLETCDRGLQVHSRGWAIMTGHLVRAHLGSVCTQNMLAAP